MSFILGYHRSDSAVFWALMASIRRDRTHPPRPCRLSVVLSCAQLPLASSYLVTEKRQKLASSVGRNEGEGEKDEPSSQRDAGRYLLVASKCWQGPLDMAKRWAAVGHLEHPQAPS